MQHPDDENGKLRTDLGSRLLQMLVYLRYEAGSGGQERDEEDALRSNYPHFKQRVQTLAL